MWLRNELTTDKFKEIQIDQEWYFAQAVNHSKQWNGVDEAESFKNQMVRTIPSLNDHNSFFANMQMPEQRYFKGASNTDFSGGGQIGSLPSGIPTNPNVLQINYLPVLITESITSITQTTSISLNKVASYGNTPITNYGIVFSISSNPTLNDSVVSLGSLNSAGSFTTNLVGLTPNTTYYIRSFATHSTGTSYGNEITFTTLP